MRRLLAATACVALPACSPGAPAMVAKHRTTTTTAPAPDVEPGFVTPPDEAGPTTTATTLIVVAPARTNETAPVVGASDPATAVAEFAAPVAVEPEPTVPTNSVANGTLPVDVGRTAVLACIRQFEGDYSTSTGNGYEGAYQFSPSTWTYAVTLAGYPEYADWPASKAPPWVQDAAAWALYESMGYGPWPPALRWCRS